MDITFIMTATIDEEAIAALSRALCNGLPADKGVYMHTGSVGGRMANGDRSSLLPHSYNPICPGGHCEDDPNFEGHWHRLNLRKVKALEWTSASSGATIEVQRKKGEWALIYTGIRAGNGWGSNPFRESRYATHVLDHADSISIEYITGDGFRSLYQLAQDDRRWGELIDDAYELTGDDFASQAEQLLRR